MTGVCASVTITRPAAITIPSVPAEMNDNEKPFITDKSDMLATLIVLSVIFLTSTALVIFALYELWNFSAFLLHWISAS